MNYELTKNELEQILDLLKNEPLSDYLKNKIKFVYETLSNLLDNCSEENKNLLIIIKSINKQVGFMLKHNKENFIYTPYFFELLQVDYNLVLKKQSEVYSSIINKDKTEANAYTIKVADCMMDLFGYNNKNFNLINKKK